MKNGMITFGSLAITVGFKMCGNVTCF